MVRQNQFETFAIEELDKKKGDPELGKTLRLKRRGPTYEDLDHLAAAYITPINNFVQEMIRFRKFKDATYEEVKGICANEKAKNRNTIPYYVIPYENHPASFILAYYPKDRAFRVPIGVSPDGFKLENQCFTDPEKLIIWFKKN